MFYVDFHIYFILVVGLHLLLKKASRMMLNLLLSCDVTDFNPYPHPRLCWTPELVDVSNYRHNTARPSTSGTPLPVAHFFVVRSYPVPVNDVLLPGSLNQL